MQTTGSLIERSHIEILRELRQPILYALSRGFRSAFVNVVDQLVEQIVTETSWERQDLLNASLDLLRNHKAGIEKHFEQACARSWQERTGVGADGQLSTPITTIMNDEPPTLRLVDDDTVRDQLMVSRISARSRRRMEEELIDGLRARFGALLEQDWFAENEYPIAPDIILDVLRETLMEFHGANNKSTTAFLIDMFEPKLSIELIELYQEVNRRLIAYRILPELRYSIAKSRSSSHVAAGQGAGLDGGHEAEHPGTASGAVRPGHQGFAAVSDEDLGRWADQVGTEAGPRALASATRYLSDPHHFGAQAKNQPQPPSDRLLDELSSLQNLTGEEESLTGEEGADTTQVDALIARTRAQSSAVAQVHGSPLDRLIIETVAQVFQHVYEDDAIANAIKQQLLRLQVAAFRAALIDPSFFARPDHPMRRFVDRLAEIGSDPDFETEPGSPLVNDLEALVTWVLNNFERELVVIAEALDRIETIVAEETGRRDERLAKIAEAAGRAERIDTIRQEVRQGLNTQLKGRAVPEVISQFIMNAWAEVIVRLRDNADEQPFDENRAERVMNTLLWSVEPKKATEIRELAKNLPQLIADLSRGLAFIAMPTTEREAFLRELMLCHGKVIEQSKKPAQAAPGHEGAAATTPAPACQKNVAASAPDAAIPGAQTGKALTPVGVFPAGSPSASTPGIPAAGAVPPAIGVGTGLGISAQSPLDGMADMHDDRHAGDQHWDAVTRSGLRHGDEIERHDDSGERKRYKLGWVSPAGSIYIFSRYPREHWTITRPKLNQMMENGEVRLVQHQSRVSSVIVALTSQEDEAADVR
ncbi:MAG: DUF1631 family protein [Lautropia sp.]|nr:DUF1631 family protein [Lautropia sp.]